MPDPPLPAPPTVDLLAAHLDTRWLGRVYEWHPICSSTNDVVAARARGGAAAGLVVAADAQTAGRGRLGRHWHSPAGENLYVSILLRPVRPPADIPPLALLVGAAIAQALLPFGVRPRLKWPNDVQLVDERGERRKLAGVLTEMVSAGERVEHVVVGLGINVNGRHFPPELADRVTSLRRALGHTVDRAELLTAVLAALEPLYEDFARRGAPAAVAAFAAHCEFPDRCRVSAPGPSGDFVEGVALGVDPDGALRLRDSDGRIHRVISGELMP